MTRPAERPPPESVRRFAPAVRRVHRSTGLLMLVCAVTALVLYEPTVAVLVGHRYLVATLHVWCGLALPAPLLLGLASPAVRADLRRLNRFMPGDWAWLRSRTRRKGLIPVGKFNAGQKLNASLSAAGILVLLGTGSLMWWTGLARLTWRTGATFVHDWTAIALGLLVFGHLAHALGDPVALHGMRTGDVPLRWARRHHGAWAAEVAPALAAEDAEAGDAAGDVPAR